MAAPLLRIDLNSGAPAYRQIVDAVRAVLVQGALRAGDKLPPVRQLALDLGVHFNTVAEAYRLLAEEGWLDLKRRRGARVLARQQRHAPPAVKESFARRLRQLIAEVRAEGLQAHDIQKELELIRQGLES